MIRIGLQGNIITPFNKISRQHYLGKSYLKSQQSCSLYIFNLFYYKNACFQTQTQITFRTEIKVVETSDWITQFTHGRVLILLRQLKVERRPHHLLQTLLVRLIDTQIIQTLGIIFSYKLCYPEDFEKFIRKHSKIFCLVREIFCVLQKFYILVLQPKKPN